MSMRPSDDVAWKVTKGLLPACDRGLLLAKQADIDTLSNGPRGSKNKVLPLSSPDIWDLVLSCVTSRG